METVNGLPPAATPLAHSASHENGGSDEVSVAGLSGLLADGQTPLAHKTSHQAGGSDEINVGSLSGELTDDQPALAHTLGGARHQADTVADVNALISDGLIDTYTTGAWGTVYHKAGGSTGVTIDGGQAVLITNKTGGTSVKGMMLEASGSTDNAVTILAADAIDVVGTTYQSGVADGSDMWIVTSGVCQVLLQDSTASTRDYWIGVSTTQAGRVDVRDASPPSAARHFQECGHCLETVGSGTNVLCWIDMHFN